MLPATPTRPRLLPLVICEDWIGFWRRRREWLWAMPARIEREVGRQTGAALPAAAEWRSG